MGTLGGIPLEVGDVLAKKYRLEGLVGEGGTGVVVAATHLQLQQRVAIKFLRTALASDEVRLRFEREAEAIRRLQSEHVVLVLDVGTLDDGEPYMVQEYLEGKDLAIVLKEDGPLELEDAVDCMLQVCEALTDAHANGIVHRDLKPANLFLTRRDDGGPHIKVVDFGISKILYTNILGRGPKEMTGAFEVLGSPRYMAPEQLRNSKAVDHRADLWSVGAVLFQLITGRLAFEGDSNVAVSLAVLTGEPHRLRELAPHAPAELEEVVARCLAKDVARRWQSARELAAALAPFASDRTRDSLERLEEAREAPSLNIALDVASMSGGSTPPPRRSVPVVAAAGPMPAAPVPIPRKNVATVVSPRHRAPSLPPPSFEGSVSSVREVPGGGPTNSVKIAIVAGGIFAVIVLFGVLTGAKYAARSLGLLSDPAAEVARSAEVAPPATAAPRPDPVTIPLDAGHKSP